VLSLSNLEFLSLCLLGPSQSINWDEIFQHCTEVTTVKVYGRGAIDFLRTLAPPKPANTTARGDDARGARARAPDDDDNHGPAPIHMPVFPKLTSLLLESLDFHDAVPGWGVLYDLILSVVQRRTATKTPLTTLCIDNCVISAIEACDLEMLVPHFHWDEDEGPGSLSAAVRVAESRRSWRSLRLEISDNDLFASD